MHYGCFFHDMLTNRNINDPKDKRCDYDMTKFSYNHPKLPLNVLNMKCILFPINYFHYHWALCVIMHPGKILDAYAYHNLDSDNGLLKDKPESSVLGVNEAPCILIFDSSPSKERDTEHRQLRKWLDDAASQESSMLGTFGDLFSKNHDNVTPFPVIQMKGK